MRFRRRKRGRPKTKNHVALFLRVPPELKERLKILAIERNMTLGELVEEALTVHVTQH